MNHGSIYTCLEDDNDDDQTYSLSIMNGVGHKLVWGVNYAHKINFISTIMRNMSYVFTSISCIFESTTPTKYCGVFRENAYEYKAVSVHDSSDIMTR